MVLGLPFAYKQEKKKVCLLYLWYVTITSSTSTFPHPLTVSIPLLGPSLTDSGLGHMTHAGKKATLRQEDLKDA